MPAATQHPVDLFFKERIQGKQEIPLDFQKEFLKAILHAHTRQEAGYGRKD